MNQKLSHIVTKTQAVMKVQPARNSRSSREEEEEDAIVVVIAESEMVLEIGVTRNKGSPGGEKNGSERRKMEEKRKSALRVIPISRVADLHVGFV
ncbi:unnamed protein product [Mycena citricolor]|uniref:Uncharacterized protein n=1 Tax=Mycena citricolor TaxID=2018698 RepID=A0AAD2HWN8_9AGAR|nr:unnamed protein product [Mycena citricolor]